ncbi:alpha/beta hydrolase [Arthrobacter sp. I2-34]|uniref:Alpha/beta hydrolase n=1 Tax=Arthrobacter hankyongi TaxID=2904801 RepID=A0ABS9L6R2_9MICC|nr:alpha/beta hydrolase [Arthrobacter hankyongi]MCG2622325.1 alpha/beta hydrolase [Arthrobacter hankyongi]
MRLHSSPERMVFVHGAGVPGAAAWTNLHGLALEYDCLFVRRHGFAPNAEPEPTDFAVDMRIVLENLGSGGHVVAHAEGAVAAMMAAVERPDLVRTLTLFEPACLSLTVDLPVTSAYLERRGPLFAAREGLDDEQFAREFFRLAGVDAAPPLTDSDRTAARRLRLQAPPWEAPLHIVPGLPTLVVTGGWEPLYEEVADYLVSTGAVHRQAGGNHRPQDTAEGRALLTAFLRSGSGQSGLPGAPR